MEKTKLKFNDQDIVAFKNILIAIIQYDGELYIHQKLCVLIVTDLYQRILSKVTFIRPSATITLKATEALALYLFLSKIDITAGMVYETAVITKIIHEIGKKV